MQTSVHAIHERENCQELCCDAFVSGVQPIGTTGINCDTNAATCESDRVVGCCEELNTRVSTRPLSYCTVGCLQ